MIIWDTTFGYITNEKLLSIISGICKINLSLCQSIIVRCCFKIPGADGRGAWFTHEESGGNDLCERSRLIPCSWICLTFIMFSIMHIHINLALHQLWLSGVSRSSRRNHHMGRHQARAEVCSAELTHWRCSCVWGTVVTHQSPHRSNNISLIYCVSICFRNTGNMIHLLLLKMRMATSMAEDLRIWNVSRYSEFEMPPL